MERNGTSERQRKHVSGTLSCVECLSLFDLKLLNLLKKRSVKRKENIFLGFSVTSRFSLLARCSVSGRVGGGWHRHSLHSRVYCI